MRARVVLSETADADPWALHEWVESEAGPQIADAYIRRVHQRMFSLGDFPRRGTPRGDLVKDGRSVTFEGRLLILFRVTDVVEILRVVSTARDLPPLLRG